MQFNFFATVIAPIIISILYIVLAIGHLFSKNYIYSMAYLATAIATGAFALAIVYSPKSCN